MISGTLTMLVLTLSAVMVLPSAELRTRLIVAKPSYFYVGLTDDRPASLINHKFELRNLSGRDARIVSVEAGCGCSAKTKEAFDFRYEARISAGDAQSLNVQFPTAPVPGVPDIRDIVVRFEPADLGDVHLTVVAKRLEPLSVFPSRQVVLDERVGEQTVFLVALYDPDWTATLVDPQPKGLELSLSRVTTASLIDLPATVWNQGSVYQLSVSGQPHEAQSTRVESIRLRTSSGESPLLELKVLFMSRNSISDR